MSFGRLQNIANVHIAQAAGLPAIEYVPIITVRGTVISVFKTLSIIHASNFAQDLTTITHLTVMIPLSQQRVLTSSADGDLSVKILMRTMNKKTVAKLDYRGIVVNNHDPDMESPTIFLGESDQKALAVVTLELMDESMWFLRCRQVGGIYHETDGLSVVRALLADTLPTGDAPEGQLVGVEYEEEEQQPYRDILIPDSESFLSVFDYLQNRYGVYSQGLGVFLYKHRWYIFQPWDSKKFSSAKNKLVIINLPKEKAAYLNKTCHIDGDVIYLICGGDVHTFEDKDSLALNQGTGYRVGSIRALDGRASSFSSGDVSATTSDTFVSAADPTQYPGGVVNAPIDPNQHFSDTDKPQRSKLAAAKGTLTATTWNASTYGLLRPGMAVKYIYANNYGVYTRYGTLVAEVFQGAIDGGSAASPRFNTISQLTLWLTNENFTSTT